ncbi:MAG: lysine biosynthesis protein LysX [Nitrososphaerales archaeon]
MTLGLVYDRIRVEEKELIESAKSRGIDLKLVDTKQEYIDIHDEKEKLEEKYGTTVLIRCVSYFRGFSVGACLENKGIKVINNTKVLQICGNKLLTSLALVKAKIPTPKTMVSFSLEGALESSEKLGYPSVLKPLIGSWGRMVVPLKDRDIAKAMIEMREEMSNPLDKIYYIQEYVDRPPRDIRCIVVGDEIVSAIYRYSPPDDWRTNVARGGTVEPYPVNDEFEDLILRTSKAVGGGVLGVDAMESKEHGILIHEINSTVEFRGAASVSKCNIADEIIKYALKLDRR